MVQLFKEKIRELKLTNKIFVVEASPAIFEFEERVSIQCFSCKRYNHSFTCPPKIPNLNYKRLINEYVNCVVVYCSMPFNKGDYSEVRVNSSNLLHRTLLKLENVLRENNHPLALSLIGGSCKLCKSGCNLINCNTPNLARIPLEATGINVVKSLKKIGIEVVFPVKDKITRYGLLLW